MGIQEKIVTYVVLYGLVTEKVYSRIPILPKSRKNVAYVESTGEKRHGVFS